MTAVTVIRPAADIRLDMFVWPADAAGTWKLLWFAGILAAILAAAAY
jgi:hypothetical protein